MEVSMNNAYHFSIFSLIFLSTLSLYPMERKTYYTPKHAKTIEDIGKDCTYSTSAIKHLFSTTVDLLNHDIEVLNDFSLRSHVSDKKTLITLSTIFQKKKDLLTRELTYLNEGCRFVAKNWDEERQKYVDCNNEYNSLLKQLNDQKKANVKKTLQEKQDLNPMIHKFMSYKSSMN